MSELGDLLELMHDARNRWRTVRATVRRWRHHKLSELAWKRYEERASRAGSTTTIALQYAFGSGDAEPEPETSESITRVWIDGERAREEHDGDWGPRLGVRVGDVWWSYDEHSGAISNQQTPEVRSGIGEELRRFLDPTRLMGALDFELLGRITLAGRPAIRIRALARDAGAGPEWEPMIDLPLGADVYEIVLDEERGVLLKLAAQVDGQEFNVIEVAEIGFDEEFPPETFVFEAPPGETIRNAGEHWIPRALAIEEAQREAPFTVWIPSKLDAGWQMRVHYLPRRERPPVPASVSIHYYRPGATHQFTLHETAVGEGEDPFGADWRPLERHGEKLRVWEPEEGRGQMPSQVQVERDGTHVTFHSSDLSLDAMLELVDVLVVAPSEPPPLTSDG